MSSMDTFEAEEKELIAMAADNGDFGRSRVFETQAVALLMKIKADVWNDGFDAALDQKDENGYSAHTLNPYS